MRYLVICLLLMAILACRKENKQPAIEKPSTKVRLMTQKPWLLTGYGFDDNDNKQLEDPENMIQDCMRDNTYEFFADSTGLVKENLQLCNSGTPVTAFRWEFRGEQALLVSGNAASIIKLDENHLVLRYFVQGLNDSARFIAVYIH